MDLLHKAARGAWTRERPGYCPGTKAAPSWLLDLIEYGQLHQVDVVRDGVGGLLR
jgi:hypothetical protein